MLKYSDDDNNDNSDDIITIFAMVIYYNKVTHKLIQDSTVIAKSENHINFSVFTSHMQAALLWL